MKIIVSKSDILERIKISNKLSTDADLARFLGISPATLSNWRSRGSIDYDLVFSKCEHCNFDWLLTGSGEMLRSEQAKPHAQSNKGKNESIQSGVFPHTGSAVESTLREIITEKDSKIETLVGENALLKRDVKELKDRIDIFRNEHRGKHNDPPASDPVVSPKSSMQELPKPARTHTGKLKQTHTEIKK